MATRSLMTNLHTLWELNRESTSVEFGVKQFGIFIVRGWFTEVHGQAVTYGNTSDSAAIEVIFDAASIQTGIAKRDEHLRSADFLNVTRFPAITFRSTAVQDLGEDRFRVTGDLTVRGITRQVVLDAAIKDRDERRVTLAATTSFDRRDFGVGSRVLPVMVGNTVTVRIALVLRVRAGSGVTAVK